MRPAFTASPTSISLRGKAISGATDRQQRIAGFYQEVYSRSRVLCIGAGGLISNIAPTLVRKGIGSITLLDDDIVEASNLNRQRFYEKDLGRNKAIALAENLIPECTTATEIRGLAFRLEDAIARGSDLSCDVAICGVDNNPARVAASRFFRSREIPVIFCAVSSDADHGYVFIQEKTGPCIGCLFPDMATDDRYPCPGTPAVADILQSVGACVAYTVDSLIASRARGWVYRRLSLGTTIEGGINTFEVRPNCRICGGFA